MSRHFYGYAIIISQEISHQGQASVHGNISKMTASQIMGELTLWILECYQTLTVSMRLMQDVSDGSQAGFAIKTAKCEMKAIKKDSFQSSLIEKEQLISLRSISNLVTVYANSKAVQFQNSSSRCNSYWCI